jgi:type IV pilus assembly protein PilC
VKYLEFRYSVIDSKGLPVSGVIEAASEDVCRKIFAQRGLFCLELTPASIASRSLNIGGKLKYKTKDLAIFCRQFSAMLSSGIGVIKCLDILYTQCDNPAQKLVLKKVYESVQRGQSFSASLKSQSPAFPEFLINMVEAGESSGTLDGVMERAAANFEKTLKTGNKVKSAMMYPIILGILTVVVVIILMVAVLPVFAQMFEAAGTTLPLPTRMLMGLSNSLLSYWYVYIIVVCIVSIGWMNFLKSESGRMKFDTFKTKMPVIGKLNITVISARFARTLSTLMQSGIPMLKSIEVAAKVLGNKYFEKVLYDIREEIRRGTSLSVAIKRANVFPAMLVSMISIGEESGTLDDVLSKTAAFYDEEADAATVKMVGLMEPLMIVVMALVIGFVVISIALPMFGMMQNVG